MPIKRPTPAAVPTAVAAPAWPADLAPPLEPGIHVALRCGVIKNWFRTELLSNDGTVCRVRFPHGDEEDVSITEIVPFPNRGVFQVGDLVAAHQVDAPLVHAVVRTVSGNKYEVEWDASRPLHPVTVGELTFQEWLVLCSQGIAPASAVVPPERKAAKLPAPDKAAPAFAPGVVVAIRGRRGYCLRGWITKVASGGYSIEYPSGDRQKVKEEEVFPVPDRPVFRIGDEVLAVWSGNRINPGRISGLSRAGYVVTWDDGSAPHIVPLGKLTFRAWAPAEA